MGVFSDFDFSGFWKPSRYAAREYVGRSVDQATLRAVEQELGYKLPFSYVAFMKFQNGGIPRRTCHRTKEPTSWAPDHIAISGLYSIGSERPSSLCGEFCSQFWIDEWGYPPIGVYFADCPSAGHHPTPFSHERTDTPVARGVVRRHRRRRDLPPRSLLAPRVEPAGHVDGAPPFLPPPARLERGTEARAGGLGQEEESVGIGRGLRSSALTDRIGRAANRTRGSGACRPFRTRTRSIALGATGAGAQPASLQPDRAHRPIRFPRLPTTASLRMPRLLP
jgi:hypothetical protein